MDGIADRADRSREKPVRDLPYIRESVVRDETSAAAAGKYCAYNQTRECFLCSDIESGDFPPAALDARLRSLAPGFTTALWLTPFRGISATSVRIPLDLIYLDPNFVVLDVVESFPISSPSSGVPATSVLALPANTIADAGTRVGDRLILCPPGEMKRRVQQLLATPSEGRAEPIGASGADPNNRGAAGRVLQFVDRAKPNSSPESSAETAPLEIVPAQMPPAEEPELAPPAQTQVPVQEKPKTKGWLQKLLNPDPPQPRKAQRDLAQGLVAFYFTGGDSAPHAVRDISSTGLYLMTDERWYPGTVIRMTLTDLRRAKEENSIMVYASVVRWANDGVGLAFAFADERSARNSSTAALGGANKVQMESFIRRIKNAGQ
jgi:hypothetical protein